MEKKMKTLVSNIQKIDLLNFIDSETLSKHIHQGNILIKSYPKDSVVHDHLAPCKTLDIILTGKLTINRFDAEGNVVHITQFERGETLGGNLLFATKQTYPFEISTLEESSVILIKKETVIEFIESNRYFLLSFMTDLSDKSLILTHAIHSLSERTLRQKIIQYLKKETERQGSKTIEMRISKKLLAERFGVARTSLSRELNAMQDAGIITFEKKIITLHDQKK